MGCALQSPPPQGLMATWVLRGGYSCGRAWVSRHGAAHRWGWIPEQLCCENISCENTQARETRINSSSLGEMDFISLAHSFQDWVGKWMSCHWRLTMRQCTLAAANGQRIFFYPKLSLWLSKHMPTWIPPVFSYSAFFIPYIFIYIHKYIDIKYNLEKKFIPKVLEFISCMPWKSPIVSSLKVQIQIQLLVPNFLFLTKRPQLIVSRAGIWKISWERKIPSDFIC